MYNLIAPLRSFLGPFLGPLIAAIVLAAGVGMPSGASAQGAPEQRVLRIEVGTQSTLSGEGVVNYSEVPNEVLDVRVAPDGQFILVGLRPGTTTLLLIYLNGRQVQYRITVVDPEESANVPATDNIRLDFYFILLSESYGHNIGIGWANPLVSPDDLNFAAEFDLTGPSLSSATASITHQPLPRLDLLQSTGWARVARQASIVTANGTEGSFFGGEEINIPITSNNSAGVETLSFGARVGVVPRYDPDSGRIELRIRSEMSDLTSGRGTGLPGRLVSEAESVVNLGLGEAVVLAGITAESAAEGISGLPGLSQIPIIGVLFGTHQRTREFSQSAVFIIPSVVDVVSQQAQRRIVAALDVYWEYSGDLDSIQLNPVPGGLPSAAHPDAVDNRPATGGRPTAPERNAE